MVDDMRLRDCLRVPQEPGTCPSDIHNEYLIACVYMWRCQGWINSGIEAGKKSNRPRHASNIKIYPDTGLPKESERNLG